MNLLVPLYMGANYVLIIGKNSDEVGCAKDWKNTNDLEMYYRCPLHWHRTYNDACNDAETKILQHLKYKEMQNQAITENDNKFCIIKLTSLLYEHLNFNELTLWKITFLQK